MAQEAAIRAFVHVRRRGMTGDNLVPLMNQIARNMLIDRHRRGLPQMVALDDAAESTVDLDSDPTDVVVSLEARKAVRDAVNSLPGRHRDAILYALAGMTPAEVAERMGIGRNAADALLHRARRSLKDRLSGVAEGAFGLVAIAAFRIREAARKAGVRAGIIDPSAMGAAHGSIGAAAAAIVVALHLGAAPAMAAVHGTSFGSRSGSATPVVLAAADARDDVANDSSGSAKTWNTSNAGVLATSSRGGNPFAGEEGETRIRTPNPNNPHKDILGIDYEVYDNGEHSGPLAEQEDAASEILCGATPEGCDALRKGVGG